MLSVFVCNADVLDPSPGGVCSIPSSPQLLGVGSPTQEMLHGSNIMTKMQAKPDQGETVKVSVHRKIHNAGGHLFGSL